MVGLKQGKAILYRNTSPTVDTFAHTFRRNGGAWSECFEGFVGATTSNLGLDIATPDELRLFTVTLAETCKELLVPGANYMSHGEAADNLDFPNHHESYGLSDDPDEADRLAQNLGFPHAGYGPTTTCMRWDQCCAVDDKDLSLHGNCLTREAAEAKGLVFLPDWIRGETILIIQATTKAKWS